MRSPSASDAPASSSHKGSPNDSHKVTSHQEDAASIKEADFDLQASSFESNHPKKNLGVFVVICMGWNICNSWAGVAVTCCCSR